MSAHNSVPKYPRSEGTLTMMYTDDGKNFLETFGTTVPTDGTAGYATGCTFHKTNGTSTTALYVNEGSATSCDFNPVVSQSSANSFASTVAVTTADALTVGGIIVPQHIEIAFHLPKLAADTIYNCFIARRAYTVTNVSYVPTILQGGAMTVTPVKATGTSAPAAATTPLTTAAFDGNANAHTVQNGTLTATGADLVLAAGDRLGAVLSTASTVGQGLLMFSLKRS